jgi:hypothetical protein
MTVKLRTVIATAVAALFLLAGCSMPTGVTGVRAGDVVITSDTIDATLLAMGYTSPHRQPNEQIVVNYIKIALLDQYAAENDVVVTDGEIDELVGSFGELSTAAEGSPAIADFERRLARANIIAAGVQGTSALEGFPVEVNPKYGVDWDPAELAAVRGPLTLASEREQTLR